MKIEFTDDEAFVRHCLTSPKAWRMGIDDRFQNVDPNKLVRIEKRDDLWVKTPVGVFIGRPMNCVTYDCHIALLQSAEGRAVTVGRQVMEFVFTKTTVERLNASIPSYNLLARRLAEKCGFKLIGINEKSFLRNGVLHNQHFYGISKH